MNKELIKNDIAEFKAAIRAQNEIYATSNDESFKARRQERWAAQERIRVASENIIMIMVGHFKSSLANVGLVDLYNKLAAGTEMPSITRQIAEETVKFLESQIA